MKTKEIPWFNQPWTRVKRKDISTLNDAELLAAVLGGGNTKENALDLSNRVLGDYNFNKLANLSLPELRKAFRKEIPAIKIQAMFEIFRRTNKLAKHGFTKKIETAEDVYNHFVDELKDKKKEHFYALFLDTKNRIIDESLISVGILDASLIHAREVFSPAIKVCSRSVILVHNHPSGDCTPSKEDEEVTRVLRDAGEILGVSLLDHFIIGRYGYSSMKAKGGLT